MSYVNKSTLEAPGAYSTVCMLHIGVSAWYIALNRMLFSLWAVSASSNFSVADLASKQSTQRAFFLFCSNLSIRVWFLCLPFNSPVAFGCIWALFVSPWWLCYKTSKSRLSDSTIQPQYMPAKPSANTRAFCADAGSSEITPLCSQAFLVKAGVPPEGPFPTVLPF